MPPQLISRGMGDGGGAERWRLKIGPDRVVVDVLPSGAIEAQPQWGQDPASWRAAEAFVKDQIASTGLPAGFSRGGPVETSGPSSARVVVTGKPGEGILIDGTQRSDAPILRSVLGKFRGRWSSMLGKWFVQQSRDWEPGSYRFERAHDIAAALTAAGLPARAEVNKRGGTDEAVAAQAERKAVRAQNRIEGDAVKLLGAFNASTAFALNAARPDSIGRRMHAVNEYVGQLNKLIDRAEGHGAAREAAPEDTQTYLRGLHDVFTADFAGAKEELRRRGYRRLELDDLKPRQEVVVPGGRGRVTTRFQPNKVRVAGAGMFPKTYPLYEVAVLDASGQSGPYGWIQARGALDEHAPEAFHHPLDPVAARAPAPTGYEMDLSAKPPTWTAPPKGPMPGATIEQIENTAHRLIDEGAVLVERLHRLSDYVAPTETGPMHEYSNLASTWRGGFPPNLPLDQAPGLLWRLQDAVAKFAALVFKAEQRKLPPPPPKASVELGWHRPPSPPSPAEDAGQLRLFNPSDHHPIGTRRLRRWVGPNGDGEAIIELTDDSSLPWRATIWKTDAWAPAGIRSLFKRAYAGGIEAALALGDELKAQGGQWVGVWRDHAGIETYPIDPPSGTQFRLFNPSAVIAGCLRAAPFLASRVRNPSFYGGVRKIPDAEQIPGTARWRLVASPDAVDDDFYREAIATEQAMVDARNAVADAVAAGVAEFKKPDETRFVAVLTPDASEPGSWRYSWFDRNGPFSHQSFKTKEEALWDLADEGFVEPDPGGLDRLASDPAWAQGAMDAVVNQIVNGLGHTRDQAAQRAVALFWRNGQRSLAAFQRLTSPDVIEALRRGEVPEALTMPVEQNPRRRRRNPAEDLPDDQEIGDALHHVGNAWKIPEAAYWQDLRDMRQVLGRIVRYGPDADERLVESLVAPLSDLAQIAIGWLAKRRTSPPWPVILAVIDRKLARWGVTIPNPAGGPWSDADEAAVHRILGELFGKKRGSADWRGGSSGFDTMTPTRYMHLVELLERGEDVRHVKEVEQRVNTSSWLHELGEDKRAGAITFADVERVAAAKPWDTAAGERHLPKSHRRQRTLFDNPSGYPATGSICIGKDGKPVPCGTKDAVVTGEILYRPRLRDGSRPRIYLPAGSRYPKAGAELYEARGSVAEDRLPTWTRPAQGRKVADHLDGVEGAPTFVYVTSASGFPERQEARYRLVPAERLIPSHKPDTFEPHPGYPPGVQERQYHRDASEQLKVIRNAQGFRPDLVVTDNPDAANGPPVVLPSGVVLGGNSRVMSMQRVYGDPALKSKASDLVKTLKARAQTFGFLPSDIGAVDHPILVRIVEPAAQDVESLRDLVRRYNEALTQGLDPTAAQVAAGGRITESVVEAIAAQIGPDETLNDSLTSGRSKELLAELQRSGFIDPRTWSVFVDPKKGLLNEDGRRAVIRAILGRVLPDPGLLEVLGPELRDSLANGMPAILAARAVGGERFDLLPHFLEATRLYADMQAKVQEGRLEAKNWQRYLAQTELLSGPPHPLTEVMLAVLNERSGVRQFQAGARRFLQTAQQYPAGVPDMFGGGPDVPAIARLAWCIGKKWSECYGEAA